MKLEKSKPEFLSNEPRTHGCAQPWNLHISCVFLYCAIILASVAVLAFLHFSAVVVVALIIVHLLELIPLFICVLTDPTDPVSLMKYEVENAYDMYCQYCDHCVSSTSKHCRVCNRCVDDFDHHCKWMNNCIGRRNYRSFFTSTLGLFLLLSLNVTIVLLLLLDVLPRRDDLLPFYFVHLLITGIPLFPATHLLIFHIYLSFLGITTYEFITRKRTSVKPKEPKVRYEIELSEGIELEQEQMDEVIEQKVSKGVFGMSPKEKPILRKNSHSPTQAELPGTD